MFFRTGFMLGLGLISSIGAQNLFLIKQGLRRERAFFCALVCFLSDIALMLLSITAINKIFVYFPILKQILLYGGIIFLFYYGFQTLRHSLSSDYHDLLDTNQPQQASNTYLKLMLVSLGFSLLNPNAILDMLVILGGIANHYSGLSQFEFTLGVISASFIWFFGIVILMRYLAGVLLKPAIWRWIEISSAIAMFIIALTLLFKA